jgi:aldose sugar dehydrogenase
MERFTEFIKMASIPADNPYVSDPKAMKSLYSLGNRNIQGMAIHPETGELWTTEHGPMGGDELNLIKPGKNYGWETITYGINYNGTIITEFTHKPGLEQPNLILEAIYCSLRT